MRERRLRHLAGSPPGPDRIFWSGLWFRTHNNGRYAELLPRLRRLDAYFIRCSEARIPRGIQYRAYRSVSGAVAQRVLFRAVGARYRSMLCTEFRQIPLFHGRIVVDVDDPFFEEPAVSLFRHPNVTALVTLADWARDRFRELGVTAPIHVVPQGVDLSSLTDDGVREVRRQLRPDAGVVVGYMASLLSVEEDREVDPLYDVTHLLELWEEIHARVPQARLWLVGRATERLRRRCEGREDVLLVGELPRALVLPHLASFDIALYPRRKSAGIQAAKVAEYMGAGVPTVSYDYQVVDVLRETGAGVLADSPRDFVDAVTRLAVDEGERSRIAAAARAAGAELDWDRLAERYETEILDPYLTP